MGKSKMEVDAEREGQGQQLRASVVETRTQEAWKANGIENEQALRARAAAHPHSVEDLVAEVARLTDRPHDYGTCVYAMSLAAVAAFNYVAHELGVTGFQASCADMDILRRTRNYQGPFMVVNGNDLLYPQYDLHARLDEFVRDAQPWCKEQAAELLAKSEFGAVAVRDHWKRLAADEEQLP